MFLQTDQRGQGLIEVTVAGSILVLVLGLVSFMSSVGLRTLVNSQIREEATFLAQQGIEVVKSFKDRNWGQVEETGALCSPHPTCPDPQLLAATGRFHLVPDGSAMCIESISNTYRLRSGTNCPAAAFVTNAGAFERRIVIEDGAPHPFWLGGVNVGVCVDYACNVRKVTVTVNWGTPGGCSITSCTKLVSYLSKWKEPPR